MKLEVTRDVVSDLWPLYRAGDASVDSRGLVEAYLAADAAFASTLKESEMLSHVVPPVRLSPEGELRLLQDAQQRARTKLLIVAGSIAMGGLLLVAVFAGALWVFMSGRMS
jgi:hypothetical protein